MAHDAGLEPDLAALSGLACLKLLLNFHQIPAELDPLRHTLGEQPEPVDLVRLAKALGAKSRLVEVAPVKLERQPLPAIARMADGAFVVVGKVADGKVLVHAPSGGSGVRALDEFRAAWLGADAGPRARGELILLTTRERSPAARGHSRAWRVEGSRYIPT